MLDRRTSILLDAINKRCTEGSYKVLAWAELKSELPEKYKIDKDNLTQMIEYLSTREFVSVKYSDENEICLAPLPRGRLYNEKESEIKTEQWKDIRGTIYTVAGSAIAAFAGAMIAVLILK